MVSPTLRQQYSLHVILVEVSAGEPVMVTYILPALLNIRIH